MTQKYNRKKRANSILVYIKNGYIKNDLQRREVLEVVNDFYELPESNMVNNDSWRNAGREIALRTTIPFNELEDDIRKLKPYLKGETQNNNTDQNITINKSDFYNLMVRLSELEKENMILKNKLNNKG